MKILALETSSSACSVALALEDEIRLDHQIAPMQQTKIILNSVDQLLKKASLTLTDLDAIAFGSGPGSFTGVRIATSVAQGLGFAAGLPLIAISSLAALAQTAFDTLGWKKIIVMTDARIGEVYYGVYEVNQHGLVQLKNKELLSTPAKLEFPDTKDWYGVGNGWEVYQEQILYSPVKLDTTCLATAAAIARLAQKGELKSASEVEPVYLRNRVTD